MSAIVVGVDGSPDSHRALAWAVEEARIRDVAVEVIHAWQMPVVGALPGSTMPQLDPDFMRKGADEVVSDALASIAQQASAAGVAVSGTVVQGPAGRVLAREADGALMLVVGSRGLGGFAGLLLGSVGHHLAHASPVPLVLIPQAARAIDS